MTRLACFIAILLLCVTGGTHAEPVKPESIRVIDGDTIKVGEIAYRLVGFDAPETGDRAQCRKEAELGERATLRMRTLVMQGQLDIERIACSCRPGTEGTRECNYGRACAVLRSKARDVASIMIEEKLARSYVCSGERCPRRLPWCE